MIYSPSFKRLSKLSALSFLIGISSNALAAGFYVPYMNASDLGDAYAGGAAIAQDASTNYSNSAGLTRLSHQQLVISGTGLLGNVKYSGTATGSPSAGTSSINPSALIPAIHYALPLTDKLFFGASFTVPYGVSFNYPNDSINRYDIVNVKSLNYDISPSLAYKLNEQFSIGAGIDAFYMSLSEKYMIPPIPFVTTNDSTYKINDLSGWGFGWHAGVLYEITPQTRLGLNYRSQIVDQLSGNSELSIAGGPAYTTSNVHSRMTLPPTTTLSLYQQLNQRWATMGTVEYTQWNVYRNLPVQNAAFFGGHSISTFVPQNYHNSWRYALGTSYQLSPSWLLRAGVSYDQSATNNNDRDLVVPEASYVGASVGGHYQATKNVGFDMGYMHNFCKRMSVNYSNATGTNKLTGNYKPTIDALGLQMAWNIT